MFPRTERPRRWIDAGRAAAVLLLASAALAGCDVSDEKSPWALALTTGDEVIVDDLESFAAPLRELARQEGLRACKVVPVPDPDGDPETP